MFDSSAQGAARLLVEKAVHERKSTLHEEQLVKNSTKKTYNSICTAEQLECNDKVHVNFGK